MGQRPSLSVKGIIVAVGSLFKPAQKYRISPKSIYCIASQPSSCLYFFAVY
jgi:hypothetical protein